MERRNQTIEDSRVESASNHAGTDSVNHELKRESLPETICVLGRGAEPALLGMREALRFKARRGSLLVHDAVGRGAMLLSAANKFGLEQRRVVWVDLADRRHPVALFQMRRSAHFRALWLRTLRILREVTQIPLAESTLTWAVEVAYALSSDGSVGLGALLRALSSAETRRWFLDSRHPPADMSRLSDLLSWCLSFSAVHALSEGVNRGNLVEAFEKPSIVWIESPKDHFEPREATVVQILIEAAIEDAMRYMAAGPAEWTDFLAELTVLHLYPSVAGALTGEQWVNSHGGRVRHVTVHHWEPDRLLASNALDWAKRSEFIWLLGPVSVGRRNVHEEWLTQAEAARVSQLSRGELWLRSNRSGRSIVSRVGELTGGYPLAGHLRIASTQRRHVASVPQAAAAVHQIAIAEGASCDLYAQLCEVETLRMGWMRVKGSRSKAAGVDGITPQHFAQRCESEIAVLAASLRSGHYQARPLRRIQIPKPDGTLRNLGLACVRDRVVQAACLQLLEPVFDPRFSRYSFAFRPGRNAHQAIGLTRSLLSAGRSWAVIADIRKCFDNIDHDILLSLLAVRIADQELLTLIRHWLTIDVVEFRELLPTEVGVPQGESISPLLANVYLDTLDKHFEKLGLSFVRYADDLVILTESEESAQEALRILAGFLHDCLRLELKPAKTQYVSVAEGFEFLGFHVSAQGVRVQESKARLLCDHIEDELKDLGFRGGLDPLEVTRSLLRLNALLRGWRNYYSLPQEPILQVQLEALDRKIDESGVALLPESVRANATWLCRERLSLTDGLEASPVRGGRSPAPAPGLGYPVGETTAGTELEGTSPRPDHNSSGNSVSPDRKGEASSEGVNTTACLENVGRLYVMTNGSYLTAGEGNLIVRKRKVELYRIPFEQLTLIYVQGYGISMSIDSQVKLAQHDIPVVFAPPFGTPVAVVQGLQTNRSSLRRLQAIRRDEPEIVSTGLGLISAKMANQSAVLKYFSKYRRRKDPKLAASLMAASEKIDKLSESARKLDPSQTNVRGVLMGLEGHGAALYWREVSSLLPAGLGFDGRVTYSASDPINQCLNYVYGMLYGEVWRAVVHAGLDPYFGIVHGSLRDQGSLVFDLIEEFRAPFADRVVLALLGRGFQPQTGRDGFLRMSSRHYLIRGFHSRWLRPVRYRSKPILPEALLANQAKAIAEVFRGLEKYVPYRMKW